VVQLLIWQTGTITSWSDIFNTVDDPTDPRGSASVSLVVDQVSGLIPGSGSTTRSDCDMLMIGYRGEKGSTGPTGPSGSTGHGFRAFYATFDFGDIALTQL
jgi:hypothetical protein